MNASVLWTEFQHGRVNESKTHCQGLDSIPEEGIQEVELCLGTEVKLFGLNSVLSVGTQEGLSSTVLVPWSKPKSFSLGTQSG